MENYKALWSQDIMSTSIFTFHEKLLAAVQYIRKLSHMGPQWGDQTNVTYDIEPVGCREDILIFF